MNEKDHRLDDYFKQYKDLVFRNLLLFVDYHTAEDLCQETFVCLAEMMEETGEVPNPAGLKKWLLVVSENLARDHLRKGGRIRTIIGLRPIDLEIPDPRMDVERIVEEREESRNRRNMLERLKQEKCDWYDALILKYVGRMSDKEISSRKGVQMPLIGKWRQRGREKLKEWYEKEYPERDR